MGRFTEADAAQAGRTWTAVLHTMPPWALLAGASSCPCKVTATVGKEKSPRGRRWRLRCKCLRNSSRLRPTRYAVDIREQLQSTGHLALTCQGDGGTRPSSRGDTESRNKWSFQKLWSEMFFVSIIRNKQIWKASQEQM